MASQLLADLDIPPNPNVTSQDRPVPGPDGAPDITVRIYRPAAATGMLPGIYFIHGGGMILGDIDGELGFDPDRLAVYGGSAGGGLTIATSMLARDRGGPAIRFQMPIYPRLMRAGVPVELHVYPGAYHAAEMFAPDAPLSQRIWAARFEALRRALE